MFKNFQELIFWNKKIPMENIRIFLDLLKLIT
jgi:hypothetical protein